MPGSGYETLIDQASGRVIFARTMTQEQLIAGARQRYSVCIGELQRRYGKELESSIRHIAGEWAQEIVDDVFMTLPRRLEMYVENGKFDRWLFGIAFNLIRTRLRSERRRREEPWRNWDEDPAQEATGAFKVIERDTMERAAASLPESERETWLLAFRGYDAGEIGELLGISANAAAVRIHRARKRLHQILDVE